MALLEKSRTKVLQYLPSKSISKTAHNYRTSNLTFTTHKVCSKGPVVGEDVGEGEGHGEGAEEDVRDGQVRYEDVPGRQHCLRKDKSFSLRIEIFYPQIEIFHLKK